ncbi:MAG: imidazoleglycerol-phosphate dehydratase HisB [Candidatus Wallbacteria bacterium]|nr:imidazoleglycerol-phosphate dehydratase HisB [Candidatus Wallbacteria bacterium]
MAGPGASGQNNRSRKASIHRKTKETDISVELNLDGTGDSSISTPVGFFTHMLENLARHGRFDLTVKAEGDLHVDQHHLLEDCGIVLGQAFNKALGNKMGINRAGFFVYPMDEALAVVAVDFGGRPFLQYDAKFKRRLCGDLDTDLLQDFCQALAAGMGANLVVRMQIGRSDHHKIEAIFKAMAKALQMACSVDSRLLEYIPSTKGAIGDDSDH